VELDLEVPQVQFFFLVFRKSFWYSFSGLYLFFLELVFKMVDFEFCDMKPLTAKDKSKPFLH